MSLADLVMKCMTDPELKKNFKKRVISERDAIPTSEEMAKYNAAKSQWKKYKKTL